MGHLTNDPHLLMLSLQDCYVARILSWTTFHKLVLFVSLIYFSLVMHSSPKHRCMQNPWELIRLRFLLPDLTYYIIKTFCQPTAQDAEVSCTTVQPSAGQMVAQLAANRRCYLRRRCTQAQRPSTSQDVTYPQIEIDMWPRPGKRDYSFRSADWTIRGGLYGPDRLARGPPLKTVFYGFIKVIVSSLHSFSKSQLSSHTH